jgi:hypothetical protein
VRTRRAEFYEPGWVETCCCLPGSGASRASYLNMPGTVRGRVMLVSCRNWGPRDWHAVEGVCFGLLPSAMRGHTIHAIITHLKEEQILSTRMAHCNAACCNVANFFCVRTQEWSAPVTVPLAALSAPPNRGAAPPTGGGGGGGSNAPAASGGGRSVSEAKWMCDMEQTGRGFRGELELEVEVQDYGRFLLPLQAKVYSMGDHSAKHGVCNCRGALHWRCGHACSIFYLPWSGAILQCVQHTITSGV